MREYNVGQTVRCSDEAGGVFKLRVVSVEELNGEHYLGIRNTDGDDFTIAASALAAMEARDQEQETAAARARALDEEPAPAGTPRHHPDTIIEDRLPRPSAPGEKIEETPVTIENAPLSGHVASAIKHWHEAQVAAIAARLRADEIHARALLEVSEGQIRGVKAGNDLARRAYADLQSGAAEGSALRSEAKATALRFWVEALRVGR